MVTIISQVNGVYGMAQNYAGTLGFFIVGSLVCVGSLGCVRCRNESNAFQYVCVLVCLFIYSSLNYPSSPPQVHTTDTFGIPASTPTSPVSSDVILSSYEAYLGTGATVINRVPTATTVRGVGLPTSQQVCCVSLSMRLCLASF